MDLWKWNSDINVVLMFIAERVVQSLSIIEDIKCRRDPFFWFLFSLQIKSHRSKNKQQKKNQIKSQLIYLEMKIKFF